MEGGGGKAAQLLLESAKGNGALVEVLRTLGSLQTDAVLDEIVNPPVAVFLKVVPGLSVSGGDQRQRAVGIVDLGVQIRGDGGNIFLKLGGIVECLAADLLKNIAASGSCHHQVGFIDVTAAVALTGNGGGVQPELAQNVTKNFFHDASLLSNRLWTAFDHTVYQRISLASRCRGKEPESV